MAETCYFVKHFAETIMRNGKKRKLKQKEKQYQTLKPNFVFMRKRLQASFKLQRKNIYEPSMTRVMPVVLLAKMPTN